MYAIAEIALLAFMVTYMLVNLTIMLVKMHDDDIAGAGLNLTLATIMGLAAMIWIVEILELEL